MKLPPSLRLRSASSLFAGLLLAASVALFAGCDSISDGVASLREKIDGPESSRTRTYNASSRTTYEAVRQAVAQIDFRITRGGAAQGELEAVSSVGTGETQGSARQVTLKVRLHSTPDGSTEVTARFEEILEDNASARNATSATGTPLRDTPLYEVFLRAIQQAIDNPKKP